MRLLDLDLGRAEEVATEHGGGKAQARQADATTNLAEQLAGMEVLVNSAHYPVNLAAMGACLEVGCHYMDLGGLYHVTAEQLELSPRFEQGGLLAVLGAGSAPGKSNLMAARAVRELGGEAESISVAAAGRDLDPPGGMAFPYAVRTLIAEISEAANGPDQRPAARDRADAGRARGSTSAIRSVRRRRYSRCTPRCSPSGIASAPSTSPSPSRSHRRYSSCFRSWPRRARSGVAEAARAASPPSPNTLSAHVVEASAGQRVVRAASFTPANRDWGLGGGDRSRPALSQRPQSACWRAGSITATGALPPERCIDPEQMFAELETRGVRFEFTSRLPLRSP